MEFFNQPIFGPYIPYNRKPGFHPIGTKGKIHPSRLISGTLHGTMLEFHGSTETGLRSQNFVDGTTGWALFGDGTAQLHSLTGIALDDLDDVTISGVNPHSVVVEQTATSTQVYASYSMVFSLPTGLTNGNLLLAFCSLDTTDPDPTPPSGWTELKQFENGNTFVYILYRTVNGTEGATATVNINPWPGRMATVCYEISGWTGTPEVSSAASGSSTAPNPDALTPSWGADGIVFAFASIDSDRTVSAYPSGYDTGQSNINGTGTTVAIARKDVASTTEDPGAFTITVGDTWAAATVAVQPSTPSSTGAADNEILGYDSGSALWINQTAAELNLYEQSDFINTSAGAGDAGKPIVLDAAGHIDATMLNDADIDHGSTGGLSDDDHTQYLLVAGTRAMTGDLDMGTNAITNVGNVDGVDVSAHAGSTDSHHAKSHAHDGVDGSGTVAHSATTGITANDHHNEAHTVASHSDTTATGAELETLTDGSDAGALHKHDAAYFTEAEHINSSAGAGDAGKPIVLDAGGHVDATMINDADISHDSISDVSANDHHNEAHQFDAGPHSGITTASLAVGDVLYYNGAGWENRTRSNADLLQETKKATVHDQYDATHTPSGTSAETVTTMTITNPGRAVKVIVNGMLQYDDNTNANTNVQAWVDISDDGGTGWAAATNASTGRASVGTTPGRWATVAYAAYYTGTPSGNIQIRLRVQVAATGGAVDSSEFTAVME